MKILTITAFLAFFMFFNARAQEVWTLENCIEFALTNNIQVKQQLLQVESNKADVLQSKLTVLPSLNGFASHGYNYGKTVDRYTNAFATERVRSNNFYLSSSITLFEGFQKINQVRQSEANLQAVQYDKDKFLDDISLNIATAYLQILYYKEVLKTSESQLTATELQAERLKKLVNAGAIAQGDYYNIEAQRAAENSTVVDARNNLDLSYLTLEQILDLPPSKDFEIEVPELVLDQQASLLESPDQVYGYALETQPSIKSAEQRVKSSEYGLMMAKGGQSPSLTLQGSMGTGYSGANKVIVDTLTMKTAVKPFEDQINDNINKSFSFNLSVPIFNGWATRTSISKAKINLENSKYNLDLSKLALRKTIEQATADARAAHNKYQSSQMGVDAARESYRYAEQKFNLGGINSVDYNNAKKDLEKAESELVRAKYEYIFKTTILDFYMGKPITLKRK